MRVKHPVRLILLFLPGPLRLCDLLKIIMADCGQNRPDRLVTHSVELDRAAGLCMEEQFDA
jgi:hypothetical protein